ncbi:hypothetical protein DCS_04548 [Drechmeria coniospora]|uniref:Rhoptry protein n=1 Tax=Drechmeria coniospora TaxID=98403 RepID=A0A151GKB3_DRECN|nr:hypothetical protein DCS_04548 [Drechmeria coniospora]KYK57537.1 hypothetical protein DCS_04548 [Drechmeria coniospora]
MNANRANPFNSPPSSTGSHGTVSPTMSSVFSDPEGESTRRLNNDMARITAPRKLPINWEAAHRKWPEFFSLPPRDAVDARPPGSKENRPPPALADDSTQDAWQVSRKKRADMQPRVDNESDISSIFDKSPLAPAAVAPSKSAPNPSPLSRLRSRASDFNQRHSAAAALHPHPPPRRDSAVGEDADQRERRRDGGSPLLSSAKSSLTAVPSSPESVNNLGQNVSHVRSFFMPDVSHLGDFVTGTLKFSGSMKNGVPIFVKHGRVHDRQERPSAGAHAEVDAIEVPRDEEKIFVSMDMIRDEILSLQEHHDKVQEYAENLQQQVERLEAKLRSSKYADGHQSDGQLTRLEEATRKCSDKDFHNMSLIHERDRAVGRLQSACDDISKLTRKLSVKEKELESSHKQLETTDQMRHDNDTLRRDLISLQHGREALERENASLRVDNEELQRKQRELHAEIDRLRSDISSLRHAGDSLADRSRAPRPSNPSLEAENEDLRENLDGVQHELDAAREDVETLRRRVETMTQERTTLQEDNESLVRHNDKYFSENKILRRENSGFERSMHDLHDENVKIKAECDALKQQLGHCRPLPKEDVSARLDDEVEENMTSAFFVPDITINTNESGPEVTDTKDMPAPSELEIDLTSQSYKMTAARNDSEQETRDTTKPTQSMTKKQAKMTSQAIHGQKVSFSIPEKSDASDRNVANRGSKRRSRAGAQQGHGGSVVHLFQEWDDTTGIQSVENTTQDQVISLNLSLKDERQSQARDAMKQSRKKHAPSSSRPATKVRLEAQPSTDASKGLLDRDTCPALSDDARQILDVLCKHSCQNCIVCTRITSHRGVVASSDVASGKKRVLVPRPVPVSDRDVSAEDATVRPSQSPGHALALVIKGLEDESRHIQLELSRVQAEYNGSDKSLGRRERLKLADGIRTLLKRLEVKNDQIYSLYDVLEGQKAAGQAMSEEEIEVTVLNITGMTVRDVTSRSENASWDGIQDVV